jgi:hypothetical protein
VSKIGRFLQVCILGMVLCHPALASTITFDCSYETYSDRRGNHKVNSKFAMTFLVDSAAGKAYMIGSVGSTDVRLVSNTDGLTFIEVTATGNVMVTVISNEGQSVHSRNGLVLGEIVPSQYYGRCNKRN